MDSQLFASSGTGLPSALISTRLLRSDQLTLCGTASGMVAGSRESVVEPPLKPSRKRPPFLGVAAFALPGNRAGDTTTANPSAEARAKNSRRVILPCDSNFSSSFSFDIFSSLLIPTLKKL